MSIMEESWLPEAEALGYSSEKEMLTSMYDKEGFSIKEIGKVLGFADWSVRRRLIAFGIKLRGRGGPNKAGKRRLMKVSDDELFNTTVFQLMEKYQISQATVFVERRLRKTSEEMENAILPNSAN